MDTRPFFLGRVGPGNEARAMAAKTKTEYYYSAHNVATGVNFGTQASVHDSNHYDLDTIFIGLS